MFSFSLKSTKEWSRLQFKSFENTHQVPHEIMSKSNLAQNSVVERVNGIAAGGNLFFMGN